MLMLATVTARIAVLASFWRLNGLFAMQTSNRGGGKHRKSPILQIFEMFYGERMLDTELRAELAGLKGKKQQQWRAHMQGKRRYKLAVVVPAEAPQ